MSPLDGKASEETDIILYGLADAERGYFRKNTTKSAQNLTVNITAVHKRVAAGIDIDVIQE